MAALCFCKEKTLHIDPFSLGYGCKYFYLRVCEKSGIGIRDSGFEADKKSFTSVPVSVTEVKLFD